MPILKWFPPQGQPRTFVVHKPVTTVGRALGNDVAIPSHGLAETHAQILFDARLFFFPLIRISPCLSTSSRLKSRPSKRI